MIPLLVRPPGQSCPRGSRGRDRSTETTSSGLDGGRTGQPPIRSRVPPRNPAAPTFAIKRDCRRIGMVKFVAKNLPVNNSDLYELDGYKPFSPTALSIGIEFEIQERRPDREQVTQDNAPSTRSARSRRRRRAPTSCSRATAGSPSCSRAATRSRDRRRATFCTATTATTRFQECRHQPTIYGRQGQRRKLYGGADGDLMYGGAGKDFLDGDAGVNT